MSSRSKYALAIITLASILAAAPAHAMEVEGGLEVAMSATNPSSTFGGVTTLNNVNLIGGLTKSGVGTLVLTGSNTYTGSTTVNAGTLLVAGNTTTIANNAAGRLVLGGATLTTNALSGVGAANAHIILNSGATSSGNAATINFNGGTLQASTYNSSPSFTIQGGTFTYRNPSFIEGDLKFAAPQSLSPVSLISLGGTQTISRDVALTGGGAMGPFRPSSQGKSGGSTTVNSGRVIATPFLSPQSSTWSTANFVNQTLPATQLNVSVGGSTIDASGTVYQLANSTTARWTTPTLTINNITGNKILFPSATSLNPNELALITFNGTDHGSLVANGGMFDSVPSAGSISNVLQLGDVVVQGNQTTRAPNIGDVKALMTALEDVPTYGSSLSTITAVPEPSGLALGGLAAAGLSLAGQIRRQRD